VEKGDKFGRILVYTIAALWHQEHYHLFRESSVFSEQAVVLPWRVAYTMYVFVQKDGCHDHPHNAQPHSAGIDGHRPLIDLDLAIFLLH
jgi:hypothetical protein